MNETSKCFEMRKARGDFDNYLIGNGIDIGCGPDKLKLPSEQPVRGWDKEDGDAALLSSIADTSYDFVYSSHCLEHLTDVIQTLHNWARILKPCGHLYVVVPDWKRYEHEQWPPRYNLDHKSTFSLDVIRQTVRRQNHWNIWIDVEPMFAWFNLRLVRAELQDQGYDYSPEAGKKDQTVGCALAQICVIARKHP